MEGTHGRAETRHTNAHIWRGRRSLIYDSQSQRWRLLEQYPYRSTSNAPTQHTLCTTDREIFVVIMQASLAARCRSVLTSCIHNRPCNVCGIAQLDVISFRTTAFRCALLVLYRGCWGAYLESTH